MISQLTAAQLIFIARQHYRGGRLTAAEDLCRKVLSSGPPRGDALHLAALIEEKRGRNEAAVELLRRAAEVSPLDPQLYCDSGRVCRRLGRLEEAVAAYQHARDLAPADYDVLRDLADVLHECGDLAAAVGVYRELLGCRPEAIESRVRMADALLGAGRFEAAAAEYQKARTERPGDLSLCLKVGDALQLGGRLDEAVDVFKQAAQLEPCRAEAHDRLGGALLCKGELDRAADCFKQAITLDPACVSAHVHLGDVLLQTGWADEAVDSYRKALALNPREESVVAALRGAVSDEARLDSAIAERWEAAARHPETAQSCCDLGVAHYQKRDAAAAIQFYQQALRLDPAHFAAMNNLGLTLKDIGQLDGAIDCLRKAVELCPAAPGCHSNLLYLLHFHRDYASANLFREHAAWARRHAAPLEANAQRHENDRAPQRRLRIGYVSPNFRQHPVGRFLTALFDSHDHERFEIFAYSSVRRPDGITARIRRGCDHWVDARHLSDESLARRIREDRIDILIDLTMHMADNRLLTFARKPAPIQATWLAYCSTTGMDAIDYRFTDPYLDPHGRDDGVYSEQSIRLPETYWCYDPGIETPHVNALPALRRGHVTFASLNNFCKASPATLTLWARLLRAVPGSQLFLHTWPGDHRQRVRDLFESEGVGPDRLRFFDMLCLPHYFNLHHAIDIALDPFPYTGGTTTCDALWMGVPTISLVGEAAIARSGLSILSNIGLPELAVSSTEQYLEAAVALANDAPRLAQLRRTMRDRLRDSPLMDGPRFALNLESAYRSTWQRWCG